MVLGLDTGYHSWPDSHTDDLDRRAHLDEAEAAWAQGHMRYASSKGYRVIVCTHPIFSVFSRPPHFHQELADQLLADNDQPILAWFWGHEHRQLVFNMDTLPKDLMSAEAAARIQHMECLGHGSVPSYEDRYAHVVLPDCYDPQFTPTLFAADGRMMYGHGYAILRVHGAEPVRICHIESETGHVVGGPHTLP